MSAFSPRENEHGQKQSRDKEAEKGKDQDNRGGPEPERHGKFAADFSLGQETVEVKTGLKCLGKCISQEVTMKDLVQCRKLEAKFRQLAVSDPTKRFIWLAEAEKWEHEAEAEIASHFEACNAVRITGAIDQ